MDANMVSKSMKIGSQSSLEHVVKKHMQKVRKLQRTGVPMGFQYGAQDAPEKREKGCKIRFCFWEPPGTRLSTHLAISDRCSMIFLHVCLTEF